MSSAKQRVQTLETRANLRSQPSLATSLMVAREKVEERRQNPPTIEELEAELAAIIESTEALEKSINPLSQSIAKARQRVIIPDLEEEIAALKSGRRVLIVDTGIDRDPVDS